MPSSDILREFLFALGVKVDDRGFANAQAQMAKTEQSLINLGKLAVSVGIAIAGTTLKIAELGERLFFAAQRGQTSVRNLQALEFAARNVGLSADQADAALANMASNLRTNLAAPFIFRILGVKQTSDDTENLIALLERLKQLRPGTIPYVQATNLISSQLGIDEPTINQILKNLPEFENSIRRSGQINDKLGLNADQFAKKSHETMSTTRDITENVERLSEVFATKLIPSVDRLAALLQKILDLTDRLSAATNGWSTVLGGVAALLGGGAIGKFLLSGAGRLLGIGGGAAVEGAEAGAGIAAGAEAGGEVGLLGGPLVGLAGAGIGAAIAYWASHAEHFLPWIHDADDGKGTGSGMQSFKDFIASFEGKRLQVYNDEAGNPTIGYGHKLLSGENYPHGITSGKADDLLSQDEGSAEGSVKRLVRVPLSNNQMRALVDFVYNFGEKKFAESDLLKRLNSGDYTGAASQFLEWNKVMKNGTLQPSAGLARRREAEFREFNRPDVTITQKNDISVSGSSDPKEAGRQVGKEVARVNGDLQRNMQGAVQ